MLADLENIENILNRMLDNCLAPSNTLPAMPKSITFRPAEKDRQIINRLADKLGIKTSQVIKIALRRFAEAEGLRLKAS